MSRLSSKATPAPALLRAVVKNEDGSLRPGLFVQADIRLPSQDTALLYGLFSSLRPALFVLVNIPLALVGGIVALGAFGENVSIPSSIGFIALFGIALTDGVVLVSKFEQLRERGKAF
jgi:hypothetical protein